MNNPSSSNSPAPNATPTTGFSPWQALKSKRISYLTLPLLVMATITEFVILATGWKYQQVVCLPLGMRVTFFGIGPIGATILAVELLKLPLAIWTASRSGWQKGGMLIVGLPLICLLTFQLVKDMAVYEMGTAMTPAAQFLEKATAEDIKIAQLNGELQAIEKKKTDREQKLAEIAAKKLKSKAELDDSLKRIDESRQDAITLTDYQKKELSEVESRQATIIAQFNADTDQINRTLADLRARRETELGRATKWNTEEARIENAYKAKLAAYTNKKTTYEKDKETYDNASFLKRQVLKEPVDPGVAPEREVNTILKPTLVAELDTQIKAKEAELLTVSNKRRDRIAQVDTDARRLREDFGSRSTTKRDQSDRKREELTAAQAALASEWKADEKKVDTDLAAAVQKVDGIRAEIDAASKQAESYYEAREAAIRTTQVHRIATTVEIVRGLLRGERPVSIKATAKERGDILTDQISMVRIWVYPILAFIVAFLPTLMVEVGFSTLFKPEQQQPAYRLGFFGRHLHWLYIRAGKQKILRAERLARESSAEIAQRDKALAAAKATAERTLAEKTMELFAAHDAAATAATTHEEKLQQLDADWSAKLEATNTALNEANVEKDALRDFQHAEIERQVQLRQNAWSDRLAQARQEIDSLRTANEAERTAMAQEHHKKLLDVSEDWRKQLADVRSQMADIELASEEKSAKLGYELKEAVKGRDAVSSQLQLQAESLSLKIAQAKEDAAREVEKATRQDKVRFERQQVEFVKAQRQASEEFERQLKQREQELNVKFESRLAQEEGRTEQDSRRRDDEYARQLEARVREVDARWEHDLQEREEAAQLRFKQREQQVQAQADVTLRDAQTEAEEKLRRRELEFERQLDIKSREAETRLQEELQQKELSFHARLKQREQALNTRALARETELQNQWAVDLRTREEEWTQQAESRVRATENRLAQEAQQKEEGFARKLRQREQQLQSQADARLAEQQSKTEQELRRRNEEVAEGKHREQSLNDRIAQQVEAHQAAEKDWAMELEIAHRAIEPLKALLVRTEKERDLDMQSASQGIRQVQDLKKKLDEAASVLTSRKNVKNVIS